MRAKLIDVIPNLSNEDYHARDEYSSSFVKNVVKHGVTRALELKENTTPNKAMLLGSAWHSFLEGKDAFESEVAVLDDRAIIEQLSEQYKSVRRTNDYKDFVAEFEAENEGKIIINYETLEQFWDMYNSMVDNRWVNKYALNNPEALDEVSYIWEYEGLSFRTRPDRQIFDFMGDLVAVMDWKSCRDALSYDKDIRKYRHDISAVMYCMPLNIEPDNFYFIASDKSKPYTTKEWGLSYDTIRKAKDDFHKAIKLLKHYEQTGKDLSFDKEVDRV